MTGITKSKVICTSFALVLTSCASAQNLLANPDFSAGNTGFTSQYTYKTPPATTQGQYFVGPNPNAWFSGYPAFFDHTLGTSQGSMFMADGATVASPGQLIAWAQTVSVASFTTYTFETWTANIGTANTAQLELSINGVVQGSVMQNTGSSGVWQFFSRTWNAGNATSALIEIRDLRTAGTGNDFALDDMRFASAVAPEPSSLALLVLPLGLLLPGLRRRLRG
jgi:hypothetical protein